MNRVIFLTQEPYDNYFRKYFILSMIQSNRYKVLCISFLDDGIYLYENGVFLTTLIYHSIKDLAKLIYYIKKFRFKEDLIIWSGINFSPWKHYLFIRMNFHRAIVIYDIYDYLYYDEQNMWRLLRFKVIDKIYQLCSNKIFVLSYQLCKTYKKAIWLNNASHIIRIAHKKNCHNRLGLLGSFDRRTDFRLLECIARNMPNIEIVLYGWTKAHAEIKERIIQLISNNKNIKYCGEYRIDESYRLLSTIDIGLAVYTTDSILTKYINPDKFFYYLCYGLEVISTPIPAAIQLRDWIHICKTGTDFVGAIKAIYMGEKLKNTGEFWRENNWNKRLYDMETALSN